jgi:hypothetical protein
VRLEGLSKSEISSDIWNRTCDLQNCSIVPQPTMLPRDTHLKECPNKFKCCLHAVVYLVDENLTVNSNENGCAV